MSLSKHILPHALPVPAIKKLAGKRIVLASNSPRRQEILRTFVRSPISNQGGFLTLATPLSIL